MRFLKIVILGVPGITLLTRPLKIVILSEAKDLLLPLLLLVLLLHTKKFVILRVCDFFESQLDDHKTHRCADTISTSRPYPASIPVPVFPTFAINARFWGNQ